MYNNPYINNINSQANIDRINNQISELQRIKEQMQQPTPTPTNLTQNFQLAPTQREAMKYANSIDDVRREQVGVDTPYFSKDMSVVWVKNTKGDIKTYELVEIIPKDEKDIKIEYLQAQIEELKKGLRKNEYESTSVIDGEITDTNKSKESPSVSTTSRTNKKSK